MGLFLKAVAIVLGIYLVLVGSLWAAMFLPPGEFAALFARVPEPMKEITPLRPLWLLARAGSLEIGDPAPDFDLQTFDKRSTVRLSSFRGEQPVVLVFGSYT